MLGGAASAQAIDVTVDAPATAYAGGSFTVTAHSSIDVGTTPYFIRVIDDDAGSAIASCGSGTTCTATVTPPWPTSDATVYRHFHAEVSTSSSAQATVAVQPYDWGLQLGVDHSEVVLPDGSFTLTATTNRDVGPTPYSIKIIEPSSGVVHECGTGTTCQLHVAPGWSWNSQPAVRSYHAVVSRSDWPYVPATTPTIDITPIPFIFTVSVSQTPSADGSTLTVTATTDRDVGPSPYHIAILDGGGTQVASCGSGTSCVASNQARGTYHAAVLDSAGTVFGSDRSDDDVRVTALGTLLAGIEDPCVAVAAIPTQSRLSSSLGDLGTACLEWQQAGLSAQRIAALVVRYAPAAGLAWLLINATELDNGTWVPGPTAPPTAPPVTLNPPTTLPSAWDGPLAVTISAISTRNAADALTDAQVEAIATHCLWESAQASNGMEICRRDNLPIWVTGTDVPEASQHDLEAMASPQGIHWFRLNYRKASNNPSPRSWKNSYEQCQTRSENQDCDEFPYYATEQGGGLADPLPHLKAIDPTQNQQQGSWYYSRLLLKCGMRTGDPAVPGSGAMFLVVPIPAFSIPIPTMGLCNGKSGITDADPSEYPPATVDGP